jgi:nucleoside-diphosphate-sugar epimerase
LCCVWPAGFIGAHIALALLEGGHTVTLVDGNFSIRHLYKLVTASRRLKVLSVDLESSQQLSAVLHAAQPPVDVVVLLQPDTSEGEAHSQQQWCAGGGQVAPA